MWVSWCGRAGIVVCAMKCSFNTHHTTNTNIHPHAQVLVLLVLLAVVLWLTIWLCTRPRPDTPPPATVSVGWVVCGCWVLGFCVWGFDVRSCMVVVMVID